MATVWHPTAERAVGNSGGAMDGDGSHKCLLHTTEGGTIEGAVATYRGANSWPTLTVDMPARRISQHVAANVAARALRNRAGGVETNREGTILIQIELIGFAANPASLGSDDDWAWLGRSVLSWARALGVPMVRPGFLRYPDSYGNSRVRMPGLTWDLFSGVLGHQHAPENDHGDPGAIDRQLDIAIAHAKGDLFMASQFQTLDDKLDRVLASLTRIENVKHREIARQLGAIRALSERVRTQLDTNDGRSVAARLLEAVTRIEDALRELREAGPNGGGVTDGTDATGATDTGEGDAPGRDLDA
jgi:hypothetical protein